MAGAIIPVGLAFVAVMAGLVPATNVETFGIHRDLVPATSPAMANADHGDLRSALATRFRAMDAGGQGIFNEDVSTVVASFFPPGQTFEAVTDIARRQGLGPLIPFKGHGEAGMAATYVAELDLADSGISNVFVAVYLAFVQDAQARDVKDALVLRRATAYLRAADM